MPGTAVLSRPDSPAPSPPEDGRGFSAPGLPAYAAGYRRRVRRLTRLAWLRETARGAAAGLFFGLLPALLVAVAAGSLPLPFSAPLAAGLCALLGLAAGAGLGLARRPRRGTLLITVDRRLASRELLSTALEIADGGSAGRGGAQEGVFSRAIVQNADSLLSRTEAREALGRLRMPLLPFAAVLAVLTTLALVFPLDLSRLLPHRTPTEIGQIGQDLTSFGEQLQNSARSRGLDRSLAMGQELAQLGRELSDRSVQRDDALDRIEQMEEQLSQQMDQLSRAMPKGANPGSGSGGGGQSSQGSAQGDSSLQSQEMKDLQQALQRLQEARQKASPEQPDNGPGGARGSGPGGSSGKGPSRPSGTQPGGTAGNGAGNGGGPSAQTDLPGEDTTGNGGGTAGRTESPDGLPGSGIGSTPAPDTRGPPTPIPPNSGGLSRVPGTVTDGDSAKLLVRSLPDWNGSKVPEERVLRQYEQQAESALARDEVPNRLKEYVKDYFTTIGMETNTR